MPDSSAAPEVDQSNGNRSRLTYVPALDGLRALAIIAVLLYHADLPWCTGGFLGVETFFVLSGYLITSVLLLEWVSENHINLRAFWLRRAFRLFPALLVAIAVTLAYSVLLLPEEVASLRAEALAAVSCATNWHLILAQRSYFEAMGRPSLLRHLWTLAVEGQFYLVWPLLLIPAL